MGSCEKRASFDEHEKNATNTQTRCMCVYFVIFFSWCGAQPNSRMACWVSRGTLVVDQFSPTLARSRPLFHGAFFAMIATSGPIPSLTFTNEVLRKRFACLVLKHAPVFGRPHCLAGDMPLRDGRVVHTPNDHLLQRVPLGVRVDDACWINLGRWRSVVFPVVEMLDSRGFPCSRRRLKRGGKASADRRYCRLLSTKNTPDAVGQGVSRDCSWDCRCEKHGRRREAGKKAVCCDVGVHVVYVVCGGCAKMRRNCTENLKFAPKGNITVPPLQKKGR